MSGTSPRVSAIVVSYRVRDLLRRCLASLAAQRGVEVETWVVDNASGDGSAEMVAAEFPGARLVQLDENLGFARANNLALAQATGELLALVNPDTELPPDALAVAAAVFARHPEAGAVGLALLNSDGSSQPACHAFPGVLNSILESVVPGPLTRWLGLPMVAATRPPRSEGRVDWVSGAFMVLSREAYARVGGLDERLFMYGEEMDWSWRARRLGYATIFSHAARVVHHGGASGEGLRGPLFVRNVESRLSFLRRHRGAWRAALAREVIVAGAALRLSWWSARAALERRVSGERDYTRIQLERFRAVLEWRRAS